MNCVCFCFEKKYFHCPQEEYSRESDTHSSSVLIHSRNGIRTAMNFVKTRIYTVSFVAALDDYSLYVFPVVFALFNVVYWLDTFNWI